MYATDYNDWMPPVNLPGHGYNEFRAQHYGRYVWTSDPVRAGLKLTKNLPQPTGCEFQNIGHLYPANSVGDGSVFFCPSYNAKNSTLGRFYYTPVLTSSTGASGDQPGVVRSSYIWNPWAEPRGGSYYRMYPKQSNFRGPGSKVLLMEFLHHSGSQTEPMNPATVAHHQSKSLVVLFTDYSVRSIKITPQIWTDAYMLGPDFYFPQYGTLLNSIQASR
jgi:hypothetical protein